MALRDHFAPRQSIATFSRMVRSASLWGVALLGLGVAGPLFAQEVRRAGDKFEVVVHGGDLPADLVAELADAALAAVESTQPVLQSWQIVPAKKVVVHLYRDRKDYGNSERSLPTYAELHFRANRAGEAHVKLLPEAPEALLRAIRLPPATEDALVVATTMAAVMQRFPVAVEEPWLAGVVGWGALEQLRNPDNRPGVDPAVDARRWFHSKPPDDAKTLGQWLASAAPRDENQASFSVESQCLVAQLGRATGSGWVKKMLGVKRKSGQLTPWRELAVEALLGDPKKREDKWRKLVDGLAPQWCVPKGDVGLRAGRFLLLGCGDGTNLKARQPTPDRPYVLRGRCQIDGTTAPTELPAQIDFAEVRGDQGQYESSLVVAFQIGTVHVLDAQGDTSTTLARRKVEIAPGVPFEYAIEVGQTLRVKIDGVLCVDLPDCRRRAGNWLVSGYFVPVWFDSPRVEMVVDPK